MKSKHYWMADAFPKAHRGMLHRMMGVAMDKPIPKKRLRKAAKAGGKLGQRARAAINAQKWRKK